MNANTTVTDPVCRMKIDPSSAVGTTNYQGETYHFCSRSCEAKFDANPGKYVDGPPSLRSVPTAAGACCQAGHSCH